MTSKALKVKGNFNRSASRTSGSKPERPAPYSLRLSKSERQYLKNKAGDMSLHGYTAFTFCNHYQSGLWETEFTARLLASSLSRRLEPIHIASHALEA